jgi:hypothetical protein
MQTVDQFCLQINIGYRFVLNVVLKWFNEQALMVLSGDAEITEEKEKVVPIKSK